MVACCGNGRGASASRLALLLLINFLWKESNIYAFQPSSRSIQIQSLYQQERPPSTKAASLLTMRPLAPFTSSLFSTSSPEAETTIDTNTKSSSKNTETKEEKLSETDARVLKAMLQDSEKMDLKTEESLQKLLERGVVSKEVPKVEFKNNNKPSDYSDSEFSSEALKVLSDTKLWKALSRKAGDWLESAKLYVVNRVERDAMTLAALGLFAWERAVRDVGRALPAAGNSTQVFKKQPLLLTSKSSVEDMTTPADELKSVGTAVAEILKSGGMDGTATTSSTGVLRTAARSRQDKRNFKRAYQRSQEKKSNPIKATQRATTGVVDVAWELRRELQSEINKPGYKTKEVQNALEAASENTRQLLQGAQEQWKLGRAKQRESKRLKEQGAVENITEVGSIEEKQEAVVSPADFIDSDAAFFATLSSKQQDTKGMHHNSKNNSKDQQKGQQTRIHEMRAQKEAERAQQLKEQEQQLASMYAELERECQQVAERLQNCIVNPEQTWLRPEVIEGVEHFDQSLIRQVVTEMIATRNSLKELLASHDGNGDKQSTKLMVKVQEQNQKMVSELVSVQNKIAEIEGHAQQAVSLGAAQALKQELMKRSESMIPILLRLDEMQHQLDKIATAPVQESEEEVYNDVFFETEKDLLDEANGWSHHEAATVEEDGEHNNLQSIDETDKASSKNQAHDAEIVDVIPEAMVYAVATTPTASTEAESDKLPSEVVSSTVELVSDDDFEAAVGEYKQAQAVVGDGDDDDEDALEDQKKEDNVVFMLFLRSLDIVFFLLEKTFTVRKK